MNKTITEPKKKPVKKKIIFEEEKAEWNITLTELIMEVEKSYEKNAIKGKYDFLSVLESARKCIE